MASKRDAVMPVVYFIARFLLAASAIVFPLLRRAAAATAAAVLAENKVCGRLLVVVNSDVKEP
jgi:hypothetical protein